MLSGSMKIEMPVLLCHQGMDPVKTLSFPLKPCLKDCQGRDPPLTAGGSAGSLWPNKSTKGCFWDGGDWIKSGRKKKGQNNNWQWVDGGMLSVCVRARSTGNCAELHNRDLHLFTLLLWPNSSEASLEGSHSTQSANCLRAPSASTQRASTTLSRAMKRSEEQDKKEYRVRSNEERESKKAREWNKKEGERIFSQRSC